MNAKIKNTIGTKGNVEISYIDPNSGSVLLKDTIHNTGTFRLCNAVTKALCGLNIANSIPAFIVPLTKSTDGTYSRTLSYGIPLSENLSYTTITEDNGVETGDAAVVAKFLIESIFLATGKSVNGFALLNANNEVLANVYKDITTLKNVNLSITWTIQTKYSA